MERQEGYYWVTYHGKIQIGFYVEEYKEWKLIGYECEIYDKSFNHINENRIKQPGELPD